MIIARAPYRVSFAGGGSDLPAFCDHEPGCVVSTAIKKWIWVEINRRVHPTWLVRYVRTEETASVETIGHSLVRECLKLHGSLDPLEITITGEIPAGTGMGSSSSLTVALLAALDALRGRRVNATALAQQACLVEQGRLNQPIGRQDQYAAAFGGLNEIRFRARGNTWVDPLSIDPTTIKALERHALLFRVGEPRAAEEILSRQRAAMSGEARIAVRGMVELAGQARRMLERGSISDFAEVLERGWALKRSVGCGISNEQIDRAYTIARAAGAWGGKLLGAGGGGYLFLACPPDSQAAVYEALGRPERVPFEVNPKGVEIIHNDEFPAEERPPVPLSRSITVGLIGAAGVRPSSTMSGVLP